MALSTDQDYAAYLDRFAATKASAPALSPSQFHRHSERLDELHLVNIECGLTAGQQQQLDELSLLLLEHESLDEALYEDDDPSELRPEPLVDDPEIGQSHPVVSPRNRREVWRLRRHRRGG